MKKRRIVAWALGALAAACLYFVLAPVPEALTDIPHCDARVTKIHEVLSWVGIMRPLPPPDPDNPYGICAVLPHFNPIRMALQFALSMLCGAAGTFIGPGVSPSRGAVGTLIGSLSDEMYMASLPLHFIPWEWYLLMAAEACIITAFGYAGGWLASLLARTGARRGP